MANFYVTISPIDTLSTSTYSIYFDEVKPNNLMLSSVPQSELVAGKLVYFTGSAASAVSVYVKNEDPDCCCAVQSYILPTPSPTAAPTTAPTTAAPTNAPTTAPTTAAPTTAAPTNAPTTAAPTTAAPTTPAPTVPYTITNTLPGADTLTPYQLGGPFNTGDIVVIESTFIGGNVYATTYNGGATLLLSNGNAGVSDSAISDCFTVGSRMDWNLTTQITFPYNSANSQFTTTATVRNGFATTSGVTTKILSVNGIEVNISTNGNKNNDSGGGFC